MVGGARLSRAPVQPRDPGPAPAGLVVQAVHPRRRRSARASALGSVWASQQARSSRAGNGGQEKFVVNNYEGSYVGLAHARPARPYSDNSVYAAVGIKVGHEADRAAWPSGMGIRTPGVAPTPR